MAEDSAKQALQGTADVPDQNKSSNKAVLAGMLLLFGIGFGAWWTFGRIRPANLGEQPPSEPVRTVLPLESFTVNLADQEQGRFLRATLSLGINGEVPQVAKGDSKGVETGGVSIAEIRDSILTVLTQCKSDELMTPQGKLKLKADLISTLNRDVPALEVQQVYFSEFLVQR